MNSAFRCGVVLVVALASARASAQTADAPRVGGATRVDASLPATSVRVGGAVLEVGCVVTGAVRAGAQLVVSCSGARIRSFSAGADGTYVLADERRAPGEISTLFVADGQAWALVEGRAQLVEDFPRVETAPSAPPSPPPPEAAAVEPATPRDAAAALAASPTPALTSSTDADAPPASRERARGVASPPLDGELVEGAVVLRFRGARAVLAPGLALVRGDRVELVPAEGTRHAPVVGIVSGMNEDGIEIDIGFGETVRVGDAVRVTRRSVTNSLLDPAEIRRTISVAGSLGVLFDAAGIGTLDELSLEWRSDLPFTLRARAFPFCALYVGTTTDVPESGGALVGGGSVDAILDTRYFAIGVGLGFGQYTTRLTRTPADPTSNQRVGFAVLPVLRIGPAEGLHIEATGNILAVIDEFRFGGIDGRINVPIIPGFWIVARGGGWPSGLGFGELGLRIAAEGNGGPGTIFVTPFVGFAGIDTGNHGFRSGPLLGVRIEGRMGQ